MVKTDFKTHARPGSRGHLIGIGGVSMSPLAEVLHGMGYAISGSDIKEGAEIERLRRLGIHIQIGHAPAHVRGADFVVRTAAAHDDNAEVQAAREWGIPVFERAEVWGALMKDYEEALCIAGTHGKTTTTSMCTHILMAARRDPTVMIGGTLPLLRAGHRIGGGDVIVMESCEYYNSFLNFFPTVGVILNIEADHLDFFKNLEDVKNSFRQFADLVPARGCVVANADDPNTMDAIAGLEKRVITFGFSEAAHVRPVNCQPSQGGVACELLFKGEAFCKLHLRVPGRHNVQNAAAAAAAAIALSIPASAIVEGLEGFTGTERRFEYKGSCNGAAVYDDYAHHPSELRALFDAAAEMGAKRVIAAFQPHTYTRTKALFEDFVSELGRPDILCLAEIYAAREQNPGNVTSAQLADRIPGAKYCENFSELEAFLRKTAKPGDLILTVGAGNIYEVGETLVKNPAGVC